MKFCLKIRRFKIALTLRTSYDQLLAYFLIARFLMNFLLEVLSSFHSMVYLQDILNVLLAAEEDGTALVEAARDQVEDGQGARARQTARLQVKRWY